MRGVECARDKLSGLGHELVPFVPPNIPEVFILHQASIRMPDGGIYLRELLNRDIRDPLNARYPHFSHTWMSVRFRYALSVLLAKIQGYERLSLYLRSAPRSTGEIRDMYSRIGDYRAMFMKRWLDEQLDALICPIHACPAPPNHFPMQIFGASTYANLYNLLDYPAGIVPSALVTEEDERMTRESYPDVEDRETLLVKSAFSENSIGLPVGVQVVALPNQDELCLRIMKELDAVLD